MSASILRHPLDVFVNHDESVVEFEATEKQIDSEREKMHRVLRMCVNEIELRVRAANCLNDANITTVGEPAEDRGRHAQIREFRQ
jgi:DNA-directed RNA polymerase subunit alpha